MRCHFQHQVMNDYDSSLAVTHCLSLALSLTHRGVESCPMKSPHDKEPREQLNPASNHLSEVANLSIPVKP